MTTTAEKIAVMQAFEDGKLIQVWDCGWWVDCEPTYKPSWNWIKEKWRIKPTPKIIYVNEYDDGSECEYAFYGSEKARMNAANGVKRIGVPFIELTPELEKLAKEGGLL